MPRIPNCQQGFTLMEVLVAISIIGLLAAVLIPNLFNVRKATNDSSAYALT
ncbi:type II secretion system protein [Deinococcus taklimakanensis]|uniref:Type II secretion system protein n=1 Tax=Deinococcus taklimakanensis TaxID=536443 RepID=A0ABW5NZN7_9DEIO